MAAAVENAPAADAAEAVGEGEPKEDTPPVPEVNYRKEYGSHNMHPDENVHTNIDKKEELDRYKNNETMQHTEQEFQDEKAAVAKIHMGTKNGRSGKNAGKSPRGYARNALEREARDKNFTGMKGSGIGKQDEWGQRDNSSQLENPKKDHPAIERWKESRARSKSPRRKPKKAWGAQVAIPDKNMRPSEVARIAKLTNPLTTPATPPLTEAEIADYVVKKHLAQTASPRGAERGRSPRERTSPRGRERERSPRRAERGRSPERGRSRDRLSPKKYAFQDIRLSRTGRDDPARARSAEPTLRLRSDGPNSGRRVRLGNTGGGGAKDMQSLQSAVEKGGGSLIFKKLDEDKDGFITLTQFQKFVQNVTGDPVPESEISGLWDSAGVKSPRDKKGRKIDEKSFVRFLSTMTSPKSAASPRAKIERASSTDTLTKKQTNIKRR